MRRSAVGFLIAALVLCAPAQARVPKGFVGLYADDAFFGDQAYRSAQFAAQSQLGVGIVRQPLEWSQVELSPGYFDFSAYDGFVGNAAAAGVQILPVLVGPPEFRSSRPADSTSRAMFPPESNADFATFAGAAVRRYGTGGSFWMEHPSVPYRPIHSWQVWNEPNIPNWWRSGPSARRYVALLRAGAAAIREADPGAEVVAAGLPNSHLGVPFLEYLAQMYRAGAKGLFDTLAIHAYSRNVAGLLSLAESARVVMNRHHDRSRLWITEFGWSTSGDPSAFRVGQHGQADRIAAAVPALAAERRALRLRGVVLFKWRDAAPPPGAAGDPWPLHTGLFDVHGAPKRSFRVFARVVNALRRSETSWPAGSAALTQISDRTVRLSPLGFAAVGLGCRSGRFGACAGELQLRAARTARCDGRTRITGATLGAASFRIAATPALVPVSLNGTTRRLARCAGSLRVRATVAQVGRARGAARAQSVVFTLRAS